MEEQNIWNRVKILNGRSDEIVNVPELDNCKEECEVQIRKNKNHRQLGNDHYFNDQDARLERTMASLPTC